MHRVCNNYTRDQADPGRCYQPIPEDHPTGYCDFCSGKKKRPSPKATSQRGRPQGFLDDGALDTIHSSTIIAINAAM
jgi:hypothetical protein